MAAILAAAGLYVFRSLRAAPGEAVDRAAALADKAAQVAAAFRSGTLVTRFASEATRLHGTARLQFAELLQAEVFERTDSTSLFWGQLELPDVIVEARAPVTYTYYVDFQRPWEFRRLDGATLDVVAPPIEWNTPAVDASAIRYAVRKGSLLRDEAAVMERLRGGITELGRVRAREHVGLVRDTGRVKIAEFVDRWLRERFADGGAYHTRVRFADEPQN